MGKKIEKTDCRLGDGWIDAKITRIAELHDKILESLRTFAECAVLCGGEIANLQQETGKSFARIFSERVARPGLDWTMAQKFMAMHRRAAKRFGGDPARLMLTDGKRGEVAQCVVGEVMTAGDWGHYLSAAGLSQPAGERGGNAALLSWLDANHPACEARKLSDLPEDIRTAWEQHLAKLRAESGVTESTLKTRIWTRSMTKLQASVEKRTFEGLTKRALEHAIGLLQDFREQLLEELRSRK